MTTDAVVIQKAITSPFILDRPKFTRILNIMEQRFSEANIPFKPIFDVTLSKGRRISIASSDELIGLDNALKDPIRTLGISAEGSSPAELSCSLSFDKFAKDNKRQYQYKGEGKRYQTRLSMFCGIRGAGGTDAFKRRDAKA
jgi:hypothetical protein